MKRKCLLSGAAILLFLTVTSHLFAQTKVITGKVTDARDGAPLAGVSVVPKGSARGTTTGPDGVFRLNVGSQPSTLVISAVGYAQQEVAAGEASGNIKLVVGSSTS